MSPPQPYYNSTTGRIHYHTQDGLPPNEGRPPQSPASLPPNHSYVQRPPDPPYPHITVFTNFIHPSCWNPAANSTGMTLSLAQQQERLRRREQEQRNQTPPLSPPSQQGTRIPELRNNPSGGSWAADGSPFHAWTQAQEQRQERSQRYAQGQGHGQGQGQGQSPPLPGLTFIPVLMPNGTRWRYVTRDGEVPGQGRPQHPLTSPPGSRS